MFISETDRIHTQNLHSVSNSLFRQWSIVHMSSNPSFSSFVFNHEMENLSPMKKYSHGTSKPYPPLLLTRLPLTTAAAVSY